MPDFDIREDDLVVTTKEKPSQECDRITIGTSTVITELEIPDSVKEIYIDYKNLGLLDEVTIARLSKCHGDELSIEIQLFEDKGYYCKKDEDDEEEVEDPKIPEHISKHVTKLTLDHHDTKKTPNTDSFAADFPKLKDLSVNQIFNMSSFPSTLPDSLEELWINLAPFGYGFEHPKLDLTSATNLKKLTLIGYERKEMPPLPPHIEELEITDCHVQTLSQRMPKLKNLTIQYGDSAPPMLCLIKSNFLCSEDFEELDISSCNNLLPEKSLLDRIDEINKKIKVKTPPQFDTGSEAYKEEVKWKVDGLKTIKDALRGNSIDLNHPTPALLQMFFRVITENLDDRDQEEIKRHASHVISLLETDSKQIVWMNKFAEQGLTACVNQPVYYWRQICVLSQMAVEKEMTTFGRIVAAKQLLIANIVSEFVRTSDANQAQSLEVELASVTFRDTVEAIKEMSGGEESEFSKWIVDTKIAYEEHVTGTIEEKDPDLVRRASKEIYDWLLNTGGEKILEGLMTYFDHEILISVFSLNNKELVRSLNSGAISTELNIKKEEFKATEEEINALEDVGGEVAKLTSLSAEWVELKDSITALEAELTTERAAILREVLLDQHESKASTLVITKKELNERGKIAVSEATSLLMRKGLGICGATINEITDLEIAPDREDEVKLEYFPSRLIEQLPNLARIEVTGCIDNTIEAIKVSKNPGVTYLSICGPDNADEEHELGGTRTIKGPWSENLTSIELSNLPDLKEMPRDWPENLKTLSWRCSGNRRRPALMIPDLPKTIEELIVDRYSGSFPKLPTKLSYLEINDASFLPKKLPSTLESLHLTNLVTLGSLLSSLPNLKYLEIANCPNLTTIAPESLNSPNLTHVNLKYCNSLQWTQELQDKLNEVAQRDGTKVTFPEVWPTMVEVVTAPAVEASAATAGGGGMGTDGHEIEIAPAVDTKHELDATTASAAGAVIAAAVACAAGVAATTAASAAVGASRPNKRKANVAKPDPDEAPNPYAHRNQLRRIHDENTASTRDEAGPAASYEGKNEAGGGAAAETYRTETTRRGKGKGKAKYVGPDDIDPDEVSNPYAHWDRLSHGMYYDPTMLTRNEAGPAISYEVGGAAAAAPEANMPNAKRTAYHAGLDEVEDLQKEPRRNPSPSSIGTGSQLAHKDKNPRTQ